MISRSRDSRVRAAGASEQPSVERTATVTELVLLMQVKDDTSPEDGEMLLDSLWTLQYLTGPGVLCAFAGRAVKAASLPSQGEATQEPLTATHVVHFRLTNPQAVERFTSHEQYRKVVSDLVEWCCQSFAAIHFDARVPAELEDMFRRGSEWESGVEHILLLQGRDGTTDEEAAEFCRQLGLIAKSSLAGALQSSASRLAEGSDTFGKAGSQKRQLQVLMTRFERQSQLQSFLALPPCQRLLAGDGKLPVAAELSTAFSIAEAQKSKSSSAGSNRLQ